MSIHMFQKQIKQMYILNHRQHLRCNNNNSDVGQGRVSFLLMDLARGISHRDHHHHHHTKIVHYYSCKSIIQWKNTNDSSTNPCSKGIFIRAAALFSHRIELVVKWRRLLAARSFFVQCTPSYHHTCGKREFKEHTLMGDKSSCK